MSRRFRVLLAAYPNACRELMKSYPIYLICIKSRDHRFESSASPNMVAGHVHKGTKMATTYGGIANADHSTPPMNVESVTGYGQPYAS